MDLNIFEHFAIQTAKSAGEVLMSILERLLMLIINLQILT